MPEISKHQPNSFCWLDLGTTEPEEAKKFYCGLFGWEFNDIHVGDSCYTMFTLNGKPVAAVSKMNPEQEKQGIPPHWLSYINCVDINETIKTAKENGAIVLLDSMQVMDEGFLGLLADTEGAVLGLWQPKNHIGMYYKDMPSAACWFEYGSHQPDKSINFYKNVFGWTSRTEKMENIDYTIFSLGETGIAGHAVLPAELDQVPSHWLPYIQIDDISKGIEYIKQNSGEILMDKTFASGIGTFGIFRDPQGAVLGLLQAEM